MPTKRQFDLIVIVGLLMVPVQGLYKMAATRRMMDKSESALSQVVSGAGRIIT